MTMQRQFPQQNSEQNPQLSPQQIARFSTATIRHLVCVCGQTFSTTKRNVKYCTNNCRRIANQRHSHTIRSQRERNGRHSQREWYEKLERCKYTCFWCGTSLLSDRGFFVGCKDHFTPLATGGRNDIDNLVPSCGTCNDKKGTKSAKRFAAEISATSNVTALTTEHTRLAIIQLVEDLATRKSMNCAIGLPVNRRRA